ncbi:hypothetical protein [Arachidicoccus soli]|jgi:hypothetical protein|uniref:Uncharacterized protein n=1 Tax=Arachidicoccus soli TaxID=2341117 RepID=A0A386HKC3_9BACT|nr:hypothetical protein [Arachidicoccus soli]AYD46327.1 hypothetical protein D6B99_01035 [Arachidicoccus soli]
MQKEDEMNTLSQVLNTLKERKMDLEFKWTGNGLSAGGQKEYTKGELKILKTFRFEGDSNPDDSAILYVLRADDGTTGYSLDAYGAASNYDKDYSNFIREIEIVGHEEQLNFNL